MCKTLIKYLLVLIIFFNLNEVMLFGGTQEPTLLTGNSEKSNSNSKEKRKNIGDDITFDFPNTDLKVFANFVAKLCKKTLIGDDQLKGQITVKSPKPMSIKDVLSVFSTILNSQGLEYSMSKVYMEIIPISDSIVKVYEINYLKSADIAKSLAQMFRMSFRVGNKPENIQITSLDESNAVMVLAPKSQQIEIAKAIKELDTCNRQVLLDIMVLEVAKDSQFGFNITYSYTKNGSTATLDSGGMTFGTSGTTPTAGFSKLAGSDGFSVNFGGLDQNTKIKVLSQPRIMGKENEKAEIKIGEKQNYVSGSSSLGGGEDQGITQTTASNDIGLDIEITPRINSLKNVILELKLKTTSVLGNYSFKDSGGSSGSSSSTNIPIIGERTVNNTSSVLNGETLVIGGILKNQKTTIKSGPMLLNDIPYVGWLFGKDSEVTEQVELMIFITPTVIENAEENRFALDSQTKKLRNYDKEEKPVVDQMLTGKKAKTDDVFNIFDYFDDGKYRKEQSFVPQPENL